MRLKGIRIFFDDGSAVSLRLTSLNIGDFVPEPERSAEFGA